MIPFSSRKSLGSIPMYLACSFFRQLSCSCVENERLVGFCLEFRITGISGIWSLHYYGKMRNFRNPGGSVLKAFSMNHAVFVTENLRVPTSGAGCVFPSLWKLFSVIMKVKVPSQMYVTPLGSQGRQFLFSQTCFVELLILCVKPDHPAKVSGGSAQRRSVLPSKISRCCYLGVCLPKIIPLSALHKAWRSVVRMISWGASWSSFWFWKEGARHC